MSTNHKHGLKAYGSYQYVPHKAVAEVSKIENYRRLVAVNHGSQSEPTAGPTSGWRLRSVIEVVVVLVVVVVVVVVLQGSVMKLWWL